MIQFQKKTIYNFCEMTEFQLGPKVLATMEYLSAVHILFRFSESFLS